MRVILIVIAAGFVVTALPASAQVYANTAAAQNDNAAPAQAQPSGGATNASAEDTRRICVNVELSGSRMVRRVCRTQAEWDARGGLESTH
jgi:hypothetical protein